MERYAKRLTWPVRLTEWPDTGAGKVAEPLTPHRTVLLDERGTHLTSVAFADRLQKWMNAGPKRLIFAVGDAYGFDAEFRAGASFELALSAMTFPHDLVRVLFAEQLYRAYSILRNEPYHHEG